MFLRFRCLDLNTRHNHSTSLRFCFQGCLQRHLDFGAADKDHLYFLFRFHHYAFDDLTDELILHPSNRHFGILQMILKFVLGHHGVVIAAVPEGDEQFAVHCINGLLLETLTKP